jgi:TRAP-type C4-dicarboxylate transport system permease small subunit
VKFRPAVRMALLAVELVLILGLMAGLISYSTEYVLLMKAIDRRSDLAGMPMWIPHAALGIGFGLIALITLWRMVKLLAHRGEAEPPPSERQIPG